MTVASEPSVAMEPSPSWAPHHWTPRIEEFTDGHDIAAFASEFLLVSKGIHAGKPLNLLPWQEWLLAMLTERRPSDGLWRYRQALVSLPRKAGKSMVSATLALYYMVVRDELGREIFSVANDRQQAALIFDEAKQQVLRNPILGKYLKVYKTAIEHPASGSVYRVLSSDHKLAHGTNPSITLFDEVWGQRDEELWQAMATGSGARSESLLIGISTPGDMRDDALFTRLWNYGKQVASGEVDDETFAFAAWQAPDGCDHRDERMWHLANPNLAAGMADIEEMRSAVQQTPEVMFRRLRLGQPIHLGGTAWMNTEAWRKAARPDIVVAPGTPIVMGFDGSVSDDATALVGQTLDGHLFVLGCWENDGTENWQVPRNEVDDAVAAAFSIYDVKAFQADDAYWLTECARWVELYGAKRVLHFTMSNARAIPAVQQLYAGIMDGQITHSDDARMNRHVSNAITYETPNGGMSIRKQSRWSPHKIDLAMAACIANDTRMRIPKRRRGVAGF